MRSLWTVPWFAFRSLLRQPRRSAMAVAAVTFGIVALMLASGFIEWIYFDLRESTIHAQLGHLQITRPGYQQGGRADPFAYLLPGQSGVQNAIRETPHVTALAPRLHFSGLASHGETTLSFVGDGVDPALESQLSRSLLIEKGSPLAPGDAQGVLFGAGLAHNLGVDVGDRVVLLVNTASGGVNAVELTVRGLFSTVTKAYDDSALRVPIDAARSLLRIRGAHAWVVLLDDTRETDAVAAALRAKMPAAQFEITPWYALADFYRKTVELFSKQVGVVRIIIGAIIVLSISNTLTMAVLERTGEIGTAMALGVRRRRILGQFVAEGAALGIVGGIVGIVLSVVLAMLVSAIGIPMPPPPGMAHGYVGQIRITPALAEVAFALAAITAIVASLYPAWRASRLVIVDALRRNR
jgi:putative ABC transport system permease protein